MYDLTDVIDIRLNFFEVQSSAPCYVLLEIRNVRMMINHSTLDCHVTF